MKKHVLIIGGGFAGLAAGVYLAEVGHKVEILERRAFLGGRAYSFLDSSGAWDLDSRDVIDNGQHLFMGCYYETFKFLKKLGTDHLIKLQSQPRVDFLDSELGKLSLNCPSLPPPLHLAIGLMRLKGLSLIEKLNTLRVGTVLNLSQEKLEKQLGQLTVKEWLVKAGQSERVQTRFWDMLSVATLNEEPDVAAATLLAKVLQQGFGGSRTDSCMAVSSVGLSELYTEQARSFIEERDGKISLRTSAKRLLFADGICTGIELANGETVKADIYISAVPYFALRQFLPEKLVSSNQYFAAWQSFKSSPIISIYLWFDQAITDLQFAGLLNARLQWLFNKNLIISSSKRDRQLLTFVISAAHKFQNFSKQQLIDIALEDLYKFIPAAKNAKLLKSLVIKEQHATHSATVESEKHRPEQKSPIKNLLLAGDWTKTGLPATIEGAVLSGRICADIVNNL